MSVADVARRLLGVRVLVVGLVARLMAVEPASVVHHISCAVPTKTVQVRAGG